ncbi:MAG: hypothetical protein ACC645_19100 [Pirellulales bacterium]
MIELNEIHHVCLESNDAGAIYAGRNWTMCGKLREEMAETGDSELSNSSAI